MAGIEHDPENDVTAIRRLLDQYSEGFAFVKELIQNANDGGATKGDGASELLIRWHPGLGKKVSHPLLRGPALLAINDGPFELKDRDGLMRMGLGSGAADPDRVGRFGLGMKAAFHVCEGFFFLEHSADPELREFCTPWHPKYYESWNIDDDSSDWEIVSKAISELAPEWKRWFCVWIPLRRHDHCEPGIVPIRAGESSFPGELDQSCPISLSRIFSESAPRPAELLLFLNRLKAFSFNDGVRDLKFRRTDDGLITPSTQYFQANVPDSPEVAASWQLKEAWPKVFGIGDRHERVNVPDKARWAGGIAISLNDDRTETPHLRVFWCVFLPVGDTPCVSIPLSSGDRDIHIFVHGYFFLNESRTAILGTNNAFEESDESTELGIRTAWNKALATSEKGVLRQLIPCLKKVQAEGSWAAGDFYSAVGALQSSEWFETYRNWVTADVIFGRMLHPGGEWKWCSVSTHQPVFVLPQNIENRSDLESLISSLLVRPLPSPIRVEGTPGLFDADLVVPWSGEDLSAWIEAIWPRETRFTDAERRYLRSFLLEGQIDPNSTDAWKNLPIYEVEDGRTGELIAVNAEAIEEACLNASLFSSEDRDIVGQLIGACPAIQIWFLRSSMTLFEKPFGQGDFRILS